jgi:hypothetical protein
LIPSQEPFAAATINTFNGLWNLCKVKAWFVVMDIATGCPSERGQPYDRQCSIKKAAPLPARFRAALYPLSKANLTGFNPIMTETEVREIPLTQGKVALVDARDYEWLISQGKWSCSSYGYAGRGAKRVFMHRLILERYGFELTGKICDHINGNRLDNRLSNLRVATYSQNSCNRGGDKGSASRFKGVTRNGKGWVARIAVNGQSTYLGNFATEEDAAIAYNKAAVKHHGNFAFLNQIPKTCVTTLNLAGRVVTHLHPDSAN